jgi:formylglycine-generating enzyme required for sulfatase activity
VSVAQFRAFVRESGHETQGAWEGHSSLENHPVVAANWYDARAYCEWLTERLQGWEETPEPLANFLREEGWQVRLPTEAEWEKAARGTDGYIYPWGNKPNPNRANYEDTGISGTSAVGCFSGGGSPYGIQDVSGNVWEWCRSLFKPYPYDPIDGREHLWAEGSRVLRGGAFVRNQWVVRCAFRYRLAPDRGGKDLGFRICVAPSL